MDRELDVDQLVDKHGMPRDLGVEFQRLLPDRVVATMPVDDRHLQPLARCLARWGEPHPGGIRGHRRRLAELPSG
jgi:hypothetical protein